MNNLLFIPLVSLILLIAFPVVVILTDDSTPITSNEKKDNSFNINNNQNNNNAPVTGSSIPLSEVHGLASAYSNNPRDSSVSYKGVSFTKPQCLYIFAKAIGMRDKGLDGDISYKSFDYPDDPLNNVITTYLVKSEYVDMAQRTANWMDNNGKAPNYTGISVAGSPDFGYEGLVAAYAMVILKSENGALPPSISWWLIYE